jgi:hypothetical protein
MRTILSLVSIAPEVCNKTNLQGLFPKRIWGSHINRDDKSSMAQIVIGFMVLIRWASCHSKRSLPSVSMHASWRSQLSTPFWGDMCYNCASPHNDIDGRVLIYVYRVMSLWAWMKLEHMHLLLSLLWHPYYHRLIFYCITWQNYSRFHTKCICYVQICKPFLFPYLDCPNIYICEFGYHPCSDLDGFQIWT